MKRILILTEHFAPAYKAGGIVRSLENLVHNFSNRFSFSVITGSADLGETQPMPDVPPNEWTPFRNAAEVLYLSPDYQRREKLACFIAERQPEVLYLNGMYSLPFVVMPLRLARRLPSRQVVIVAPRGMLQSGALSVKPFKKKVYFALFKAWGLHKNVRWHATDPQEVEDIRRMFGPKAEVVLALDTPDLVAQPLKPIGKERGQLQLVTISLITAKKGHLTLLETLKALEDEISAEYHIYGPVKDPQYWQACQAVMATLKPSIQVVYHGNIHPTEVMATLQAHHFFVLPSKGENFGHAIYEAFNAGRPTIISDQTPWKKLAPQKAGWDLDLRDKQALPNVLRQAYAMDQAEYDAYCRGAQAVARRFAQESDFANQYQALFS
jgi:glycosyltransferase involved in cell wall biosynthesis